MDKEEDDESFYKPIDIHSVSTEKEIPMAIKKPVKDEYPTI